jgi:hypothetical protein
MQSIGSAFLSNYLPSPLDSYLLGCPALRGSAVKKQGGSGGWVNLLERKRPDTESPGLFHLLVIID